MCLLRPQSGSNVSINQQTATSHQPPAWTTTGHRKQKLSYLYLPVTPAGCISYCDSFSDSCCDSCCDSFWIWQILWQLLPVTAALHHDSPLTTLETDWPGLSWPGPCTVSVLGLDTGYTVKYSPSLEGTPKGRGLYLTVYPKSSPNTNSIYFLWGHYCTVYSLGAVFHSIFPTGNMGCLCTGNTLGSEGNIEIVSFQYTTFENNILTCLS